MNAMDVFLGGGYTILVPIIPLPSQLEPYNGAFRLSPETAILANLPNLWNSDYLRDRLAGPTGFPLTVRSFDRSERNCIYLWLDPRLERLGREGYRLGAHFAPLDEAEPNRIKQMFGFFR